LAVISEPAGDSTCLEITLGGFVLGLFSPRGKLVRERFMDFPQGGRNGTGRHLTTFGLPPQEIFTHFGD
jgi:hypothetical protein